MKKFLVSICSTCPTGHDGTEDIVLAENERDALFAVFERYGPAHPLFTKCHLEIHVSETTKAKIL
jgi:hypothetical protein